jgi:hypothetical protein
MGRANAVFKRVPIEVFSLTVNHLDLDIAARRFEVASHD